MFSGRIESMSLACGNFISQATDPIGHRQWLDFSAPFYQRRQIAKLKEELDQYAFAISATEMNFLIITSNFHQPLIKLIERNKSISISLASSIRLVAIQNLWNQSYKS